MLGERTLGFRFGASGVAATALLAASATSLSGAGEAQASRSETVYSTEAICETARALTAAECRNAFANANAELDEKAPRFRRRDECERHFHRCMIGDIGRSDFAGIAGARVTFIPTLRGVTIFGRSPAERRVLPLVEGSEGEGLFQPRDVGKSDTMESGAKARQAQASWSRRLAEPPVTPTSALAPTALQPDSEPTTLDPACASLVDPLAYNACLALHGPRQSH